MYHCHVMLVCTPMNTSTKFNTRIQVFNFVAPFSSLFSFTKYTPFATRLVYLRMKTSRGNITNKLFRWVFNCDTVELWKHSFGLCIGITVYRPVIAYTVLAGIIGRLKSFDSAVESWDTYQERLKQYFICNDVANEKKVPVNRVASAPAIGRV